jgi:hypothetical protein
MVWMVTGEFDIRVTDELIEWMYELRERRHAQCGKYSYYWVLSEFDSTRLLELVCSAYGVRVPRLEFNSCRPSQRRPLYDWNSGVITVRHVCYGKSMLHAFYHHLDNATAGRYRSDCLLHPTSVERGYESHQLAYEFAQKFWEITRAQAVIITRQRKQLYREPTLIRAPEYEAPPLEQLLAPEQDDLDQQQQLILPLPLDAKEVDWAAELTSAEQMRIWEGEMNQVRSNTAQSLLQGLLDPRDAAQLKLW